MLQKGENKNDYLTSRDLITLLTDSGIRLFYEKIGFDKPEISERWEDKIESLLIEEWKKTNRKLLVKREVYVNSDYPFMASDGYIIPLRELALDGRELKKDTPLVIGENKLIAHFEMIVMGSMYCELAYAKDEFITESCYFDEDISKQVLKICRDFWYNKVIPGRELSKKYRLSNKEEKKEITRKLRALEPLPSSGEEKIFFDNLSGKKKVQAHESIEKLMEDYFRYTTIEKTIGVKKHLIKNILLRKHEHEGIRTIYGKKYKSTVAKTHIIFGREIPASEIREEMKRIGVEQTELLINQANSEYEMQIKKPQKRESIPLNSLMNRINEGDWQIKVSETDCVSELTVVKILDRLYSAQKTAIYGMEDNKLCPINPFKLLFNLGLRNNKKIRSCIVQYRVFGEDAFWRQIKIETGLDKEKAIDALELKGKEKPLKRIVHRISFNFHIPEHYGVDREESVCREILDNLKNVGIKEENINSAIREFNETDIIQFLSKSSKLKILNMLKKAAA